ncbi:hypothetical protein KY495_13325 [Massilia sp. PAMC28688]|uniref:DUF6708 domain-containing protein n=1 Tax=Massilia sp. PAMC28688 TaxID=2861283 RepID=UPI001C6327AF|nr:DUF6708 domain-containing protein [Massilia sp. PAMC28688]QYF91778.1 hypothetical protein KY495_13325 [Massilia sp. PAMC28688]
MDFTGLIGKFPVNRPLTEMDRKYQLRQDLRLEIAPSDQLAVIRLNSTFLETVDKWYGWRGFTTAFALTVLLMFVPGFGLLAFDYILKLLGLAPTKLSTQSLATSLLFFGILLALVGWSMLSLLRKESFAYTHYPVRYNRKAGIVHYFQTDGEVRSVPWRDVFFTVVPGSNFWAIRGHVLGIDNKTVLDTFAVGPAGSIKSHLADPATKQYEFPDAVRAHWEFIRRYMEEGPAEPNRIVHFCVPVSDSKETPAAGFRRVFANFAGSSLLFRIVIAPFCLWVILGRLFATATSKLPQWPAEIEDACAIEPHDPYAIRGDAKNDRRPDKGFA